MAQDHTKYDRYGKNTLNVVDPDEDTTLNIHGDRDTHSLRVASYIWNTLTLQWEKLQQGATAEDLEVLEGLTGKVYYKDTRFQYDDNNNPIYIGKHTTMNTSTGDTGWYLIKLDWDANGNCIRKRVRVGAWDDRTSGWS